MTEEEKPRKDNRQREPQIMEPALTTRENMDHIPPKRMKKMSDE